MLQIKVSSLEPIGHRIAKFQAKDADAGLNAVIHYTLKTDAGANHQLAHLFHLAEETGELFVAAKLPTTGQVGTQ